YIYILYFRRPSRYSLFPYTTLFRSGYFLDLKTFEQLYKSNCFVYYISIDGEKQTHDKQRPCKNGQGSYDKIMENLKQIKQRVPRSEEHTSELQSRFELVCRLLLEKK